MEEPAVPNPHDHDHKHPDVSGGWLRAAVFGAMDGLVSNISLIAGIGAAGASSGTIVLTGVAGLVAGSFSMALGEYTSVKTQNEQVDSELAIEQEAHQRNPVGEQNELRVAFVTMGMSTKTAEVAAKEVHKNNKNAPRLHITHELGMDPETKPSPWIAAVSSFATFATGAFIPLIPYAFGFDSLAAGLIVGAVGLVIAGGLTARFTRKRWWRTALRQLILGALAVGATYSVGLLFGVSAA
jgi:VIT1/CCC1 family predicted Fe2+/Mn2+ transporter